MNTAIANNNFTMQDLEINDAFRLASQYVNETDEHVFITGNAGTGKTSFLRHISQNCRKNLVIAAPTGIAAINAGGTTLHSLFQLPFAPFVPTDTNKAELAASIRISRAKLDIIRNMDILVIDEVSMVRADVLDAVDTILRSSRRQHNASFGGLQVLFIGDLNQLPPVTKQEEWSLLSPYYDSPFFFDSQAVRFRPPVVIEFTKIYRQQNQDFISLLNKVRNNNLDLAGYDTLNSRFIPDFKPPEGSNYITLTSHNLRAEQANQLKLDELPGKVHTFYARIENDFPEYLFPNEQELRLKVGAQVMFIKNDVINRAYFNGKIGFVKEVNDDDVVVDCEGIEIKVSADTWENNKYTVDPDSSTVRQECTGTFSQLPLRLAWAITIHKSQGLTFDRVMIDAAASFSSGQVYVALSRCKTLEGIVLLSRIESRAILFDNRIDTGISRLNYEKRAQAYLQQARNNYILTIVGEMLGFHNEIRYCNFILSELRKFGDKFPTDSGEYWIGVKSTLAEYQPIVDKFILSLEKLSKEDKQFEEKATLKGRIHDAIKYFEPRVAGLVRQVKANPTNTESREAASRVNELLNELFDALARKQHILSRCNTAFKLELYQEAKKTFNPRHEKLSVYNQSSDADDEGNHPLLYKRLRRWRDSIVQSNNIPVYMVGNSKMLQEIATLLPVEKKQLLNVKGMGSAKVAKYGEEILDIVRDYCDEFDIEPAMPALTFEKKTKVDEPKKKVSEGKSIKQKTTEITYGLWSANPDINYLARLRNLTTGTIEHHLSLLIQEGKIKIEEFVPPDMIRLLTPILARHEGKTLSEIKPFCPESVTFEQLRALREHLNQGKS